MAQMALTVNKRPSFMKVKRNARLDSRQLLFDALIAEVNPAGKRAGNLAAVFGTQLRLAASNTI
jgi:hypothetical protein